MRYRPRVTGLLILLFAITYIDRVCISVAGPRMQEDLGIDPVGWGWVTAMFTLSYCLFEIPTGALGDRIGPRRVLTRVVLWWSAFTSLTGAVSNYYLLLLTRFCFGAGEAGAFPNASIVVSRWYPPSQRASMAGVLLMASQIGGAIAPLLVVPIQIRYGWRASFYVFGAVGLIWAAVWYTWFRDSPAEKPGVSQEEIDAVKAVAPIAGHGFPWRIAFRSETVLAMMGTAFCYVYVYSFFQTWFHTFLIRGRGFSEASLLLSALPYAVAACANLAGGATSDALVRRLGPKWGRRSLGIAGLGSAGLFTVAAMLTEHQLLTLILLSLVYGGITFQQAGSVRRVPGHRREARGIDGRADEHVGAGGRLPLICRIRVHRRTLSQLQRAVRSDGRRLVPGCAALAQDRCLERGRPESLVVAVPATAV